ncbi:TorF family putative porin [Brevundimonas sp.]|uniref:TorF family putative porin n=1 Tax=Brevundimonas sp. TaxID=1871086 RepID=UPI0035634A21
MRISNLLAAIITAGTAALPAVATAQDFSGQIGVASQYVGKGLGKSAEDPSVFGSAEIEAGQFYGSVFVSTAKLSQGSDSEIVSAIGYRPEVAGFDLDLSVINRELPGTRAGVDANYMEYQADISRKLGPVATRLRVNYTPDGFAATQEAWWVEAQGTIALDGKTKASAALAERSADGGAEYVAWNVGVKRKLTDRIALDVRWFDTDGHSYGEAYDGRLVGALSFSF